MRSNLVLADENLMFNILLSLDYDNVINYCRSHKIAMNICNSKRFWEIKASEFLNISEDLFDISKLPANLRYLQIASLLGKDVSLRSLEYINMDQFVRISIQKKKWDLLDYALNNNYNNWKLIIEILAEINNKEYLNLYLEKTRNYQAAAIGAIKGNHINLFKNIYLNAPEDYRWNYNELLAISLNNINLFDFILSDLPIFYDLEFNFDDNLDLKNEKIIEKIKDLIVDYPSLEFSLIQTIIKNGDADLVKVINLDIPESKFFADNNIETLNYLLSLDNNPDWNSFIYHNIKLYDYIKTLIPYGYNINYNYIAYQAIVNNNKVIFNNIFFDAPSDYNWKWQSLVEATIISNIPKLEYIADEDIKYFNYIMSLAPKDYKWDWSAISALALHNNNKLFKYIINDPKNSHFNWNALLRYSYEDVNRDLIEYIYTKIPNSYSLDIFYIAISAAKDKDLFIELLSSIDLYNLNILYLTTKLIQFSPSPDFYETIEYLLSNYKFYPDDYIDLLVYSNDIGTFNMIGKYLPKNLTNEIIKKLKIKGKSIIVDGYINSMKYLSEFEYVINKNKAISYQENKFLKDKPNGYIYITFYDSEFNTVLVNEKDFQNYAKLHPSLQKVRFS